MRISKLIGAKIGILGFGQEGQATLRTLRRHGHSYTVRILTDVCTDELETGCNYYFGEKQLEGLGGLDVLVRSPGFSPKHPVRVAADAQGLIQVTPTNIALEEFREQGSFVIGITGSKGKSTTSTLVYRLLNDCGYIPFLAGNVGVPAIDVVDEIVASKSVPVLELSSFQCADLQRDYGPNVACLLELFPEHLDWHGSEKEYYYAKLQIAITQRNNDTFHCKAGLLEKLKESIQFGQEVSFFDHPEGLHYRDGWFWNGGEKLFKDEDFPLKGAHNRTNALAALSITAPFGVGPINLLKVLREFPGLPFRLQEEGRYHGITWINDSLSTTPESTSAAIEALGAPLSTLIVGGYDRGYQMQSVVEALNSSSLNLLILLPETGYKLAPLLRNSSVNVPYVQVSCLEEAVEIARLRTPRGRICAFSPGAPSFNLYRSFSERGAHFRKLIRGGA